MPALPNPHSLISRSALYRIRVAGRLGPEWAERLGVTLASRTAQDWGTIKKYGVDFGYKEQAVIMWGVVAGSDKFTPGEIVGSG